MLEVASCWVLILGKVMLDAAGILRPQIQYQVNAPLPPALARPAKPARETLVGYCDVFALFEDFRGYVEFFMLQGLVAHDCSAVRFFLWFDDFNVSSVPRGGDTYRVYRQLSIELISHRTEPLHFQCAWSFGPTACLAVPVCVS